MLQNIKTYIIDNLFLIFASCFIIFYIIVINKNYILSFFIISCLLLIIYFYLQKKNNENIKILDIDNYISTLEKDIIGIEIDNSIIFSIHKPPNSLKYLLRNDQLKQIIYDLKPMLIFDRASYLHLIIYIEYFLKFHYYIMINRYDYINYLSILKDIRREILNISSEFIFNSPDITNTTYNPYLKETIQKSHDQLKGFTYKYISIIKHKFNKNHVDEFYEPPWEYEKESNLLY
jgi:Ca2+/Na+ antiporter